MNNRNALDKIQEYIYAFYMLTGRYPKTIQLTKKTHDEINEEISQMSRKYTSDNKNNKIMMLHGIPVELDENGL